MRTSYGDHFSGTDWPYQLLIDGEWCCLYDAGGRCVSDACFEGSITEMSTIAAALRGGHNKSHKRCAVSFVDGKIRLCSPRNTLGRPAVIPASLADDLAKIIEDAIAAHANGHHVEDDDAK